MFKIWKEEPGVISKESVWCCSYGGWMHICDTFPQLIKQIFTEFRHDKHLIG